LTIGVLLEKLIRLNKTRADCAEKFEELIEPIFESGGVIATNFTSIAIYLVARHASIQHVSRQRQTDSELVRHLTIICATLRICSTTCDLLWHRPDREKTSDRSVRPRFTSNGKTFPEARFRFVEIACFSLEVSHHIKQSDAFWVFASQFFERF